MERVWSKLQQDIFADTRDGEGHTVVEARAGTGKTTTIVEALNFVPGNCRTLMVAFNKSIAKELGERAPAGVRVSTLHSHGLSAVKREFGSDLEIEENKNRRVLAEKFEIVDRAIRIAACKAASLAKSHLLPAKHDGKPSPEQGTASGGYDGGAELASAMAAADVAADGMRQLGAPGGNSDLEQIEQLIDRHWIGEFEDDASRTRCAELALHLLETAKEPEHSIDFDDMIWLPIVRSLSVFRNDRVFVDETQDLNRCQHELVARSVKQNGRLCAIGDSRQAIYGFRGADRTSLDRIQRMFDAKRLPLSITYRCPKRVVELVKSIVPDYEADASNPDGVVEDCARDRMMDKAAPGDFILSRTNAPLVSLCLEFLKQGRRATVIGRDLAEGLLLLVTKSKASDVDSLESWVTDWSTKQIEKALRRNPEANVQFITERRDCLMAICEGAGSVAEVKDRIQRLFGEGNPLDRIALSTTHKAKGLERQRVWMLRDTYLKFKDVEEENLFYVAATRAQRELYMVKGVS